MKNLNATEKLIILAATIVIAIILVGTVSLVIWKSNTSSAYQSSSSNNSAQSASSGGTNSQRQKSPDARYLDILEYSEPHTFASDAHAIQFGRGTCEMLDQYYLEDFEDYFATSQTGILQGVSAETRGAALGAAVTVYCPEHEAEASAWASSN